MIQTLRKNFPFRLSLFQSKIRLVLESPYIHQLFPANHKHKRLYSLVLSFHLLILQVVNLVHFVVLRIVQLVQFDHSKLY